MLRTAILKGYSLKVLYTDTSSSSHYFEWDDLEGLQTMVSDLLENFLDSIVRFTSRRTIRNRVRLSP